MPLAVFLDLYRVLADPHEMTRRFRQRMAEILRRDYGVPSAKALEIHDEAFEWYQREGEKLDAMRNIIGEGEAWERAVNKLDEKHVLLVLEMIDQEPPKNPSQYAKDFEREIVQGTDAIYPDVRPALKEIKKRGHRLFMSTNTTSHNGEAALVGGSIRDYFDDVVTLEVTKSKKNRLHYWQRAFEHTGVEPSDALIVDDVAEYLEPAAAIGAKCVQMIRPEFKDFLQRGPYVVITSLSALSRTLDNL